MARRSRNYVAEKSGPYRFKVEASSQPRTGDEMRKLFEEHEMENMLRAARYKYPKRYAKILAGEGVGPEELRHRMRFSPRDVGSLQYTHKFEKF